MLIHLRSHRNSFRQIQLLIVYKLRHEAWVTKNITSKHFYNNIGDVDECDQPYNFQD